MSKSPKKACQSRAELTKYMARLLCVRLALRVQADFRAGQAVVLGLQGSHSPQATSRHRSRLRLGVGCQCLELFAVPIFELASSRLILQDGRKMF